VKDVTAPVVTAHPMNRVGLEATTAEEFRQANMAYKKALHTARRKGYRPHIRATEGKQIQVEWVALEKV
jgi:hypothetical protein